MYNRTKEQKLKQNGSKAQESSETKESGIKSKINIHKKPKWRQVRLYWTYRKHNEPKKAFWKERKQNWQLRKPEKSRMEDNKSSMAE